MRDIVATIAAEQDEVIRAPLATCLVVQGGPGTGKTAVGLHRAGVPALRASPQLDAAGVLVVGPNPIFLRYIAQVLPSLGETAVRQTTLERLLAGTAYRRRGGDGDDTARLKGDARLAAVLARAVTTSVQPPDTRLEAVTTWGTIRLDRTVFPRRWPTCMTGACAQRRAGCAADPPGAAGAPGAWCCGEEVASVEAVDASLRRPRLAARWTASGRPSAPPPGAAAAHQPQRCVRPAPACSTPTSRRCCSARRPAGCPTSRGRSTTWRCSTRPRRCPARRERMATWLSTRRRTCRPWGSGAGAAAPADR